LSRTHTPATVSIELDSRPESLACVRAMLAGAGESVGLDRELLDDLRTAISEACSNVVLHAYDDRPGPLRVDVDLAADGVRATVSDRGAGIHKIAVATDRMRVGIPLISALADRAEFWSVAGQGTEVRMAFAGAGVGVRPGARVSGTLTERGSLHGDVVAFLSPSSLLSGVLGRVCAVLAARAHFSVDRHSDLERVTDAIAAHVRAATADGAVGFAVVVLERWLELSIGPLPPGSTADLRWAPSAGPAAERFVDRLGVECERDGETLHVLMFDRRDAAS
jgi:anti-sigma regulatory factor (Ser/Thr protein kinase)